MRRMLKRSQFDSNGMFAMNMKVLRFGNATMKLRVVSIVS